jgi:hydrogenase nickel incorporation protein HypA/HybF
MHELSIMDSALNLALERAQKAAAVRVRAIHLRVGVLSGVVPDALRFAFETLTANTPAEGASLEIEEVPARFWCRTCRQEYLVTALIAECPQCHGLSRELLAGRELEVASLEIE